MKYAVPLLALASMLLVASPGLALRDKQVWGVWQHTRGETEVDTLRVRKRHLFDRQIRHYAPKQIDIGGSEVTVMQLTRTVHDKGRWYIEKGRLRLTFHRSIDGEPQSRIVDGFEAPHVIYLSGRGGKLVIEELNYEPVPEEEQRAFERASLTEGKKSDE